MSELAQAARIEGVNPRDMARELILQGLASSLPATYKHEIRTSYGVLALSRRDRPTSIQLDLSGNLLERMRDRLEWSSKIDALLQLTVKQLAQGLVQAIDQTKKT